MRFSVPELQEALMTATEDLPIAAECDDLPTPARVFMPASQRRALRLHTLLVTGARGVGKTFLTRALEQESVRSMLKEELPELASVRVIIGHTDKEKPGSYPDPEQFSSLLTRYDALDIWRAVWWRALAAQPEAALLCPFVSRSWEEDVAAVAQAPEAADRFFAEANRALAAAGTRLLVLFDALDRAAETWEERDTLTAALLRTIVQFSGCSHITGKIFLREDHCSRLSFSFPGASRLLSTQVRLSWTRAELHGLFWQCLCNAVNGAGEVLRDVFAQRLPGALVQKDGCWLFDRTVELDDDRLRRAFHALTGPSMGKHNRRGVPYIWTVGHLADTRQQTTPRSFLAALRHACVDAREQHPDAEFAIPPESIAAGVRVAMKNRVKEMQKDLPWAEDLLRCLDGVMLPCSFTEVQTLWHGRFPQGPEELVIRYPGQTPPDFASQRWQDVRELLERQGFCMTLHDGHFNMPDIYRIPFRLGRRGGVKPAA